MRAAQVDAYGGPEQVRIREIERPQAKPGEVSIRVLATSVNTADWRLRSLQVPRGFRALMRLGMGFSRPRRAVLGTELSGVIAEVGQGVTSFRVGDAVVAVPGAGLGAHAEYKIMRADTRVVPKPPALSFVEAAAMCFGGLTALHYLRGQAKLLPGERLLVLGAAGSVGSAAVQLGRVLGAEVSATCSAKNADTVRALGAAHIIDYTQNDFTRAAARYDVILDCVGATSYGACARVLAPGGRLLRVVTELGGLLAAPFQGRLAGHRVIAGVSTERTEDMRFLAALADAGSYRPLIDSTLPFERIAEAHARAEGHKKRGSVVLELGPSAAESLS